MKGKKKCGLSFASTLRAGELLTTNPSVGPPEQVCRRRGSGSMGCEHHQEGAVAGKTWIGSSINHCPDLAWRGTSSAAIGLRGSVLGIPFPWSTLFLCVPLLSPLTPSCSWCLAYPPCSSWLLLEGSGIAHKFHVILGKHFVPCFFICSRATKYQCWVCVANKKLLRWKPGLSYFSKAEASLKSQISAEQHQPPWTSCCKFKCLYWRSMWLLPFFLHRPTKPYRIIF